MTTAAPSSQFDDAHLRSVAEVEALAGVDAGTGLATSEAAARLARYGPNELRSEPPPSLWQVGRAQLANPMNIMLLIVAVASLAIGQIATGIVVAALVTFNVVMGTNQELKAQASVDALSKLQIPHTRVRRDGQVAEVAASDLVPGDVVLVEAGDLVPADGRLVTSATLEVQEAALTGESAPVAKDPGTLEAGDVSVGDRTDMVFQNTQVTRGSAVFIVTATGAATQMGRIADMVSATKRTKSPLQRELDGMTKVFGFLAWGAVAIIAGVGIARGQDGETLVLLCISTAIASIPTGLPTFVQTMLSSGAQRLAEEKAVVKSLADVETLGGTTVINSDKTGTLTMNAMTVSSMYVGGRWYRIEGSGYAKTGAILGVAGSDLPDFTPLALGLSLCSDATVARRRFDHRRPDRGGARRARRQDGRRCRGHPSGDPAADRGAVRLRLQVHGDLPRSARHDPRQRGGAAALRVGQGRSRRRARSVLATCCTRGRSFPSQSAGTRSSTRTGSCRSRGCACSRSLRRASTTRRWTPPAPTRWPPSRTWCSSVSSASSTRCGPKPPTRCTWPCTLASTSA